jgi:glycosyltransferase involved in cell wall biosynthesis
LARTAVRRFDLVHAFYISDAWAISLAARLTGRPLILSLMGYPDAESLDAFRCRRAMLVQVGRIARAVHVDTRAAADALREETGIEARVINPGTMMSEFRPDLPRDDRPTVFCAASPADPRKRVPLLVDAFARVRADRPDARLVIATGGATELDPGLRAPGVELVDLDEGGLAAMYARAWTTVLPAAREAFGMVLVESLASGTPAVGMRDGGVPEILDDPRVGTLCETPDPDALANAIERTLELSRTDGVREACRAHAERWDWNDVVVRFEELYLDSL